MEIRSASYNEVEQAFSAIKPDLLDPFATYFGSFVDGRMVGVVSYVEHTKTVYLCHAFVLPEHRNNGTYRMLWEYRERVVSQLGKEIYAHCNADSLKTFINNGYVIEKALFKVVKKKRLAPD